MSWGMCPFPLSTLLSCLYCFPLPLFSDRLCLHDVLHSYPDAPALHPTNSATLKNITLSQKLHTSLETAFLLAWFKSHAYLWTNYSGRGNAMLHLAKPRSHACEIPWTKITTGIISQRKIGILRLDKKMLGKQKQQVPTPQPNHTVFSPVLPQPFQAISWLAWHLGWLSCYCAPVWSHVTTFSSHLYTIVLHWKAQCHTLYQWPNVENRSHRSRRGVGRLWERTAFDVPLKNQAPSASFPLILKELTGVNATLYLYVTLL